MKKIYESPKYAIEEEDMITTEQILIYSYEDEIEADDFSLLSTKEQILELGLKEEENTPKSIHGKVHRYDIEPWDYYVVVHVSEYSW